MAALNQVYVDPSIAGDSGAGTVGDPYGDLEWCLEQITPNASGDQINIKAGTAEALEFALDIVNDYGTPGQQTPLVFRGYTTAANDGGIAEITAPTNTSIVTLSTLDQVMFMDIKFVGSGSAGMILLDRHCVFINCEFDQQGSGRLLLLGNYCLVLGCYFHDGSAEGLRVTAGCLVAYNFFGRDTNNFTLCCNVGSAGAGTIIMGNVFDTSGTTQIWNPPVDGTFFFNNTIFHGTSSAVAVSISGTRHGHCYFNNVIHINHSSSIGIDDGAAVNTELYVNLKNKIFAEAGTAFGTINPGLEEDNTTLTGSPFVDGANDDFRLVPKVGSDLLKAHAFPEPDKFLGLTAIRHGLDVGALQRREWPLTHPGMGGGFRG